LIYTQEKINKEERERKFVTSSVEPKAEESAGEDSDPESDLQMVGIQVSKNSSIISWDLRNRWHNDFVRNMMLFSHTFRKWTVCPNILEPLLDMPPQGSSGGIPCR
jgi:hypothetical protein